MTKESAEKISLLMTHWLVKAIDIQFKNKDDEYQQMADFFNENMSINGQDPIIHSDERKKLIEKACNWLTDYLECVNETFGRLYNAAQINVKDKVEQFKESMEEEE